MKRVISEVIKLFGTKMIQEVEKEKSFCPVIGCHEIEKPECLKKLDRERMEEK